MNKRFRPDADVELLNEIVYFVSFCKKYE